jgi:hypothetical protein
MWDIIIEAQARKQDNVVFVEDGQEVRIRITQNGWYEGYVPIS